VVFAEGEILSLHPQEPPVPVPDVLAGANQCIADGLWGMVRKVGVPSELLLWRRWPAMRASSRPSRNGWASRCCFRSSRSTCAPWRGGVCRTMEKEGVASC